jgi:flagellin
MTIDNNIQPYQQNIVNTQNTLEKIATGLKLNSAADDASALAISENLKVQASGLSQSYENANAGIAFAQIGDRAITEQSNILDGIKEKLLEASTATTSEEGREALLEDIQKQLEQFNNIAEQTNFNGDTLLQASRDDTSATNGFQFQAGENGNDLIELRSVQSNTEGVGLSALLNQDPSTFTADTARDFLENVDDALVTLNENRSEFGSTSNQLQSSSRNLATQETNIRSAESVLSNVDYANEVSNFSKQNILAQVGAFGQAQSSNITQQTVLRLLQ